MDASEIETAFADVLDQAMLFHGFADFMRDYDIYIYATADPRTGIPPEHLRYRFKHCVSARATSAVTPKVWKKSLDERLIDYDQGRDLDGYVWGVAWQLLYPGFTLMRDSIDAQRWSVDLGFTFYEATVETNGLNLSLVFSDLIVEVLDPGFAPFTVPASGPDAKIPL